MGKTLIESGTQSLATQVLEEARRRGVQIYLPDDYTVAASPPTATASPTSCIAVSAPASASESGFSSFTEEEAEVSVEVSVQVSLFVRSFVCLGFGVRV